MGVAQNVPTTYYYQAKMSSWITFVKHIAGMAHPNDVYSISYGSLEYALSTSTTSTFDTQVIKLGVMGTTIVASSGDDGAVSWLPYTYNSTYCGYIAEYPACSPYVVAVGGTTGPERGLPEVSAYSFYQNNSLTYIAFTSGGGFSIRYSRPSYQDAAIKAYFATVDNTPQAPVIDSTTGSRFHGSSFNAGNYSRTGRGYPDISIVGTSYSIIQQGAHVLASGTSATAPAFAGFISLVNSNRVRAGKSTMGWINPFLYSNYSYFINDIDDGGRNNCTSVSYNSTSKNQFTVCCKEGFFSTKGWDPVTGLGTVNFEYFNAAALGQNVTALKEHHNPTAAPTYVPSASPAKSPTVAPTSAKPLAIPTENPSAIPTAAPSTSSPTFPGPTVVPSAAPTAKPSATPTFNPTNPPTLAPTVDSLVAQVFSVNQVRQG